MSPAAVAAPPDEQNPPTPPVRTDAEREPPGFQARGRMRRRVRFLRKARELAYRDLGGLVFSLHRFSQRNDALVLAKLTTVDHIDSELRALEDALQERQPATVLREAGITACPRCTAIHASEDNFCPNCGMPMNRHTELPVGFQNVPAAPPAPGAAAPPGVPPTPDSASPAPAPTTPPAMATPEQPVATTEEESRTEIIRPQDSD
jgi:hypothetical protein